MDSARLFKSTQTIQKRIERSVMGGVTTGSSFTSLYDGLLQNEEKQEPEKSNGSIFIEMERLSATSKPRTMIMPSDNSRNVEAEFQKMHQLFIQSILERIFRHKIKDKNCGGESETQPENLIDSGSVQTIVTNSYTSTYNETFESTSFKAKGIVNTEDGRSIAVDLSLSMSSRFIQCDSECLTTLSYEFIDPLVINMEDAPAGLSDIKFFFDLDADGHEEQISGFTSDSGFLALDKNNDGKINDGRELFGTFSGDGFKDLAAYDEDGNGWIDENDSIFEKLLIYTKDSDGNDICYTLKDKNIGAICLQNADTLFNVNSKLSGETNGQIKKTGIFLYETGLAGTVQHLDLAT